MGGSFHVAAKTMKEEASVSLEVGMQVMGFIVQIHTCVSLPGHFECFATVGQANVHSPAFSGPSSRASQAPGGCWFRLTAPGSYKNPSLFPKVICRDWGHPVGSPLGLA